MRIRSKLTLALLCSLVAPLVFGKIPEYQQEINAYIEELVQTHRLDRAELQSLFDQAEFKDSIISAMTKPHETLPWHKYRKLFITEKHIQNGREFIEKNKAILERAERAYGVPKEMITAIIGVETRYGKVKGSYRVIDALSTLGFGYPPRREFFRNELTEFLLLTKEEQLDPLSITGSYAGAMGEPQFIPSSYRNYAVDFSGNGKRDLLNSREDVIGSVANYFKKHGWKPGNPVAMRAEVDEKLLNRISADDPKVLGKADLRHNLGTLQSQGLRTQQPLQNQRVALLKYEQADGNEYWLGLHNFYVITRYNRSPNYAMAVYQLSEALKP